MTKKEVPPEFTHLMSVDSINWDLIVEEATKRDKKGEAYFAAFTDIIIDRATKESMKEKPDSDIIRVGVQACLTRGRLAEALFLSTESDSPEILSLKAVALFSLSDVEGLRSVLGTMETHVDDNSPPSDQVRLSTVKVLLAAAERDTSVIMCIMEFDNLLEQFPEQVETPLTETMFTLYVVGSLLREVGEAKRALTVNDTLEKMALSGNNRMHLALSELLRGNICNFLGDFVAAEKHYIHLKEISRALSFNMGLGAAYNNLGTLRLQSLRLEEALEFFEKSFSLMETDWTKLRPLVNMGELTTILGRYDEAGEHLKSAIRLEEKTNQGIIEPYTAYVNLLSKTGKLKQAKKFLKKAEEIGSDSEKPFVKGHYLYAKGVFEANQNEFDSAIKSLEETLRIAKENEIFELIVKSKLEITRAYMEAYRENEESAKLSEAGYHVNDIIQIAMEQGHHSLHGEALLLRSNFMLLAGKTTEAKDDLDKALSLALKIKDAYLEIAVRTRLEGEASSTTGRAVDQDEMEETFDRLSGFKPAGKLVEVPVPFLHALIALNRHSGLPEYVHHFGEDISMDSGLLGGFISAITSFSSHLMGGGGLLRSINHEGFTVMMEHTQNRILTLVVDQESFDIRYSLREFAQRFDIEYPAEEENGVETAVYEGADNLVEEVFGTKGKSEHTPLA
ncbi:MAG: tetratricopeptide repeat protein [Candidatus Thorarchaeota archaeon]|jgi:tetratricopeptide (TPR) repeat protein